MAAAYGNALMCVFPSRFEGFGLPALEAMACGTPTVLARGTSLPEVGGTAAAYFEPGNADELAAVMESLIEGEALRDASTARPGSCGPRSSPGAGPPRRPLAVYRQVLDGRPRRDA